MDKKTKTTMLLIAFAVLMYGAVTNLVAVMGFLAKLLSLLLPLIIGLVLAFVLSVPMNGFEKLLHRLFSGCKRAPNEKLLAALSFILTLAAVLCILVLVFTMLIPELISSSRTVIEQIQIQWPRWMAALGAYNIDTAQFADIFSELNMEKLLSYLTGSAGVVLDSVKTISSTIAMALVNTGLGLVIAVYALLSRKTLGRQCRRVIYAYLNRETADKIVHVAALIHQTYSKFLSGQCLEACILGSLIFISFSIAGLPHAGLIAVLTGICAFIPYVGAFAACFIGALLTLLSNPPVQALLCIAVYMATQFVENQFIYPHVVGNSVGLPPLFTLVAVMLGGKLFGLLGMIFFIPIMAVIYALVREHVAKREERRPIPRDSKFSPKQ